MSCASAPVVARSPEVCIQQRADFVASVMQRHNACQSDADCHAVPFEVSGRCDVFSNQADQQPDWASVNEACDSVPQMALQCAELSPTCVEGTCRGTPGAKTTSPVSPVFDGRVMTRPEVDTGCIAWGLGPLATQYDGMMIVKARVTARGQLNYFRVIKGPGQWTTEAMWKIAQCHAKPAAIDGTPVTVDYVLNLRFKRIN